MTTDQLRDLAEELYDNPEEALLEALQELIDEKGWHYSTTLKEAVRTHSKALERKLKQRCYEQ